MAYSLFCTAPNSPWIGGHQYNYTAGDQIFLSTEHGQALLNGPLKHKWTLVSVEVDVAASAGIPLEVDMAATEEAFMGTVKTDADNYTPGLSEAKPDPIKEVYDKNSVEASLFLSNTFTRNEVPAEGEPSLSAMNEPLPKPANVILPSAIKPKGKATAPSVDSNVSTASIKITEE
jgi:hypothetical protein